MDVKDAITITGAAKLAGVTHGTIGAAIGRGELEAETTSDGLRLLHVRYVRHWANTERKLGRPPSRPTKRKGKP